MMIILEIIFNQFHLLFYVFLFFHLFTLFHLAYVRLFILSYAFTISVHAFAVQCFLKGVLHAESCVWSCDGGAVLGSLWPGWLVYTMCVCLFVFIYVYIEGERGRFSLF